MHNLMFLALGFFVLAIFFGFIVFVQLACDTKSFKPAVWLHGLVAILGLGCLSAYTILHSGSKPWLALSILILAALGGLTLFTCDLKQKPIPKIILFLHPVVALVGLGFLVNYVFGLFAS